MIIENPRKIKLELMSNEIQVLIEELGRIEKDIYEFLNCEELRTKLKRALEE